MDKRRLVKSRLEALLTLGSGAVAEPVAGLAGLAGILTGGARRGARNVESVRDALTYQPRDPRGLQEIQRAIAPIAEPVERAKQYLGDRTMDATGSPAAAAAAYAAPETLAALLGVRAGGMRGPTMQQMAERSAGPGMGQPGAQVGAIGHLMDSPYRNITRDEFLGKPRITKESNASSLKPQAGASAGGVTEPFMGGKFTARYADDGVTVFDGDKPIASYDKWATLVVDKKYRRQGVGEAMVYEFRTRNPGMKPATHRTRKAQALQEKVWERIERERFNHERGR